MIGYEVVCRYCPQSTKNLIMWCVLWTVSNCVSGNKTRESSCDYFSNCQQIASTIVLQKSLFPSLERIRSYVWISVRETTGIIVLNCQTSSRPIGSLPVPRYEKYSNASENEILLRFYLVEKSVSKKHLVLALLGFANYVAR